MGIKILKLVKTPLKVGFLYTEVVTLFFFMTYFDIQERKSIIMFMFKSKFDNRMFCVHILYKRFQLLIRIKGDKNIINIPPINVRTKILVGNQKSSVIFMTFCQLLIAVLCYLKMLPIREGSESLFCLK